MLGLSSCCLNWDFWDWGDFWDFVVLVVWGVGLGASVWPLPFALGHPHPGPLPPSGRGDASVVDGVLVGVWVLWVVKVEGLGINMLVTEDFE